ncbi:MAG TPA: VWA domain-containing protein [Candidatus Acidoferrales bacterium]|nr:VWA domain-containing protein [Candidatus Acidoferrales bacterium]
MHLRNKTVVGVLLLWILAFASLSYSQTQPQTQSSPGKVQATPLPSDVDPSDPALPVWARPAAPPKPAQPAETAGNTPSTTKPNTLPPDLQPEGGVVGQVTKGDKGFIYRQRVDEVTLHATVLDRNHHIVTDLGERDFTVYENGEPQQIKDFRREDVPVSIGILVDNSGSMRTKRNAVSKAVVNLVQASNPNDEVFVVNFNDEPYLDQDFTNQIPQMKEALDRVDSRGGTALYDAVYAAADHLAKAAKLQKKILLVVTDGEDNESRMSLEEAIRAVQNDSGPEIYTIGILGDEGKQRRAKRALEALSIQTGGVAFFPRNLDEVDEISRAVAHDIRNQYSITYKPTNPQSNGGWREVKVVAHASGYRDLEVRTRKGYYASEENNRASTSNR